MAVPRIIVTQFCDDIRHEEGNKYSLMGCYSNELIVNKLPVVLPKLCAHLRAITPIDSPFSKLIIRAKINDDIIAEINVPVSEVDIPSLIDNPIRVEHTVMMAFSPLSITEPCKLHIEAETEDDTLRGGFLLFKERLPDNSATH